MWFKAAAPVLLALYGITAAAAAGADADADSQSKCSNAGKYLTVKTTNGRITGHPAPNSRCVIEYLGIPYAKPPTGDRRFAPPERFTADKPQDAAQFGFDCPLTPSPPVDYPGFTPQADRIISYFASGAGTNKSEDCLTLNIWSKATAKSDKAAKPVIVFFYGGRKSDMSLRWLSIQPSHSHVQPFRFYNWQHKQPLLQWQILCRC